MLHHFLIITLSWFGSVSLQYINPRGPFSEILFDPIEGAPNPEPYAALPSSRNDYENLQNDPISDQFYQRDDVFSDLQRKRRTLELKEDYEDQQSPKVKVLKDNIVFKQRIDTANPYLIGTKPALEENATINDILNPVDKRYFSPWGGKRDKVSKEHMWTWKRGQNIREPSMPKRVRFSPWGGKRSGLLHFKPSSKNSRIIFATSIPELTRIVSNYTANGKRLSIAGFHFVPTFDKRHPVNIIAMKAFTNDRTLRDALPFKNFIASLPKLFKPGHTYLDVNLNKEGKRKVKFSAWGGKRSPPIIGPIWTPPKLEQDSSLNTILLITSRNVNNEPNEVNRAS